MPQSYPLPLPPEDYIPQYLGSVTYNWPYNGLVGDPELPGNDVNVATANATGSYEPKNQGNKASMLGLPLAADITTPSGWIDPKEPYGPPATPTLTSFDPPTLASPVTEDVQLKLIGTNFMASSQIEWSGVSDRTTFVSPTELRTIIRAGHGAGVIPVRVINPGRPSNTLNFTIT